MINMDTVVKVAPNPNIPPLNPGDTVKVSVKIREGDHERIQPFQGIIIRVREGKVNASFTVRRSVYGVGVERTFFFCSPMIEKVEIVRRGKVRRARLYYLRGLSSKATRAKIKTKAREEPVSVAVAVTGEAEEALESPPVIAEVEDMVEPEAEE